MFPSEQQKPVDDIFQRASFCGLEHVPLELRCFIESRSVEIEIATFVYRLESYRVRPVDAYVSHPCLVEWFPRGLCFLTRNDRVVVRAHGLSLMEPAFLNPAPRIDELDVVEVHEKYDGLLVFCRVVIIDGSACIVGGTEFDHCLVRVRAYIQTGSALLDSVMECFQRHITRWDDMLDLVDTFFVGEYIYNHRNVVFYEGTVPRIEFFNDRDPLMTVPTKKLPTFLKEYDLKRGTEGAVLVFRARDDPSKVRRCKVQTFEFKILTFVRHLMLNFTCNTDEILALLHQSVPLPKGAEAWYTRIIVFIEWISLHYGFAWMKDVGFAIAWHCFQRNIVRSAGQIAQVKQSVPEILRHPVILRSLVGLSYLSIPVCIIMRGVCGSGRSRVVQYLRRTYAQHAEVLYRPKGASLQSVRDSMSRSKALFLVLDSNRYIDRSECVALGLHASSLGRAVIHLNCFTPAVEELYESTRGRFPFRLLQQWARIYVSTLPRTAILFQNGFYIVCSKSAMFNVEIGTIVSVTAHTRTHNEAGSAVLFSDVPAHLCEVRSREPHMVISVRAGYTESDVSFNLLFPLREESFCESMQGVYTWVW